MTTFVERSWPEIAGFSLTPTQIQLIEAVLDSAPGARTIQTIEGPAGTGKSTLLAALLVEAQHRGLAIEVAAPTHKAAKVLARMLQELTVGVNVVPTTFHSLLKLKPLPSYGDSRRRPNQPTVKQHSTPRLGHLDLVIIDECSMIGAELFAYTDQIPCSILFTGDSAQLKPVNEFKVSPTFTAGKRHVLTEVVRHDGAILNLATRARKLRCPQVLPEKDGGSQVLTYPDMDALVEAWQRRLVDAPHVSRMMLTYKNDNRRYLNDLARQTLYGTDVPDFMAGDNLVTLSAFVVKEQVLLDNNQSVTVRSAEYLPQYRPVVSSMKSPELVFPAWRLALTDGIDIYVLTTDGHKLFKKALKALSDDIKAEKDSDRARRRWANEFFALKESFAEVDFDYVCTIHKSQGSTYDEVFIYNDYSDSTERQELLYVAVTRARGRVHHQHVQIRRPQLALAA
jgi:hypothetical protein